jgi:hypothetical protein
MEVKAMKAGVEYATCDGHLVVPVAPVHSNWVRVASQKKQGGWEIVEANGVVSGDPWAGCHPGRRTRVPYARGPRGVKVKTYKVDRDGRRVEAGAALDVIPPRDVKGLWADYVVLYAHVIQAKFDEREANHRAAEHREAVEKRLKGAGLRGRLSTSWEYPKNGEKRERFAVVLEAGDRAGLERLLRRLEKTEGR